MEELDNRTEGVGVDEHVNKMATGNVKHPAKFTRSIIDTIGPIVARLSAGDGVARVLDCFGGVGGVFDLHQFADNLRITCVEIEPEWAAVAAQHPSRKPSDYVLCHDFFNMASIVRYDFTVTSPTYGNRMADHHDAKDYSKRNTYRHVLGRELTENSSAAMQWGPEYKVFHRDAWRKVYDLTKPGGYFILNVKDHIRKGTKQPVVAWHRATCVAAGFKLVDDIQVPVRGNRQGENGQVRVEHEHVMVFQRPWQVAVGTDGAAVEYAEQMIGEQS